MRKLTFQNAQSRPGEMLGTYSVELLKKAQNVSKGSKQKVIWIFVLLNHYHFNPDPFEKKFFELHLLKNHIEFVTSFGVAQNQY